LCSSRRSCGGGGGGEDNSHNQSVETESLSENEDEDHSNVDVFLGVGADTSITDNSNAETGSEGGETATEATGEMSVSIIVGVLDLDGCVGCTGSGRGGVDDCTEQM
jgi:hypothetical protein